MIFKRNYLILLMIILFISKGNLEAEKSSKLSFSVVAEIGVEETKNKDDPYLFYSIYCIDTDNKGNIYVLDGKDSCIKIFNQNGIFIRKILRSGSGPDEISNPLRLAINKFSGNIFVLHQHGFHLKEFNQSGNLVKSYPLPEQFSRHFEFIENGKILYVASGKYGEKKYDNFKVLNLNTLKIEKKFFEIEMPSLSNAYQRFVIKDGILWTCPGDRMDLLGFNIEKMKEVRNIPIKESYREFKILKSPNIWRIVLFQFAQPFLLNGEIYVLVTKLSYSGRQIDSIREAQPASQKLSLYHLEGDSLKKVSELNGCDFMFFGDSWKNRIILYAMDPYPYIKILQFNK
jgi:hypothetical protein